MKDALRLTLEEKVGQLFIVGFQGYEPDDDARAVLETIRPGGFLLFQRNIESFDQIYTLTSELRDLSPIPAFVAIDHEGGRVDRLKQLFAPIPSISELAAAGTASLRLGAKIIAAELEATGFNVNFAPVLDLRIPGSIIAERSLGPDAQDVARMGAAFVEELGRRRVFACAKHFPGLGGATIDPHFKLPRINRNRRQLLQEDIVPFAGLLDEVGMIMISHGYYPALGDEEARPASLCPRVIEGLLRRKLGYKGVVITDDLTMGAVTGLGLTPDLFISALDAGNDLLLFSQTTPLLEHAYTAILRAARKSGELRKRIDESVARIIQLKGRIDSIPLRYRAQLKVRIMRQIHKLRKSLEPATAKGLAARVP